MKKIILSGALLILFNNKTHACAWYDPDYEYFNLFTQSIIKDKTYLPFLHTLSNRFYGHEHYEIQNENIENWQKFFGNTLTYSETKFLVQKMPLQELSAFKNGNNPNPILKKLGNYRLYAEAIDYLIEAKYLEPYMRINYVESSDSWYHFSDENAQNGTQLDYEQTIADLKSLYEAAKNPEIKLRYGYQLVRFNHYTRNYAASIQAFGNYVSPLQLRSAPYYLALDQLAGAQRGLNLEDEANWNFFQVFQNSKSRKESAFISMKLSDSASFNNLLKRAETPREKNMAYFLLAYQEFSNPVPTMEKMYEIDPESELLKVLAARSINELERNYLPVDLYFNDHSEDRENGDSQRERTVTNSAENHNSAISFWQKVKNFFTRLFSSEDKKILPAGTGSATDKDWLEHPKRLPLDPSKNVNLREESSADFLISFDELTKKIKEKSNDEFWQITEAYLAFLQKDYERSSTTLNKIKTSNPEYVAEISRMKLLNDILSQPKITASYEEYLLKTYPKLFADLLAQTEKPYSYEENQPSTAEFVRDILANRYFIQGEKGKSFLMNNKLSDLQYNPNSDLVKNVEAFYKKKNKSSLEQKIIAKNINDVGNVDAFFKVIYGDREMRLGHFEKAKSFYDEAKTFRAIPRVEYEWNEGDQPTPSVKRFGNSYNGFYHISALVFGHNVMESFESPQHQTMEAAPGADFDFIKDDMNKAELADAVIRLKKIGKGNGEKAAQANQLIGNLLYNTSILGYYRHLFVMDIDNTNGPKYHFYNSGEPPFEYYYKNFTSLSFVEPDDFDRSINYYAMALKQTNDREQKARILFQMASAEQGKYYQYEVRQSSDNSYGDTDYEQKEAEFTRRLNSVKNEKYRTYFRELKENYSTTQTSKALQSTCSYYDFFMKNK